MIMSENGKTEKKEMIDLTPFRPVPSFLYSCEGRFNSECLNYLLEDNEKFGFIIVDGSGVLFATL